MSTTRLWIAQLNKYQIIQGGSVLLLIVAVGLVAIMAYRLWQPVVFQTTGGATPQEKVLNEALELLTNQTGTTTEPPGN